jgi:ubiquinone/menaquinone biosynthesis C-methylase UbiE
MEITKPDIQTIKQMMKAAWEDGDYGQLSRYKKDWDEDFISRLPVRPGIKLLDVACGTGYFCILAAKQGADVTGVDIATNLLEQARKDASEQKVNIRFDEGDAEALPYADNSFDIVTSMIGAMFAPQPEKVASELLRVCKPGGTVAMANWTAEGITGEMFGIGPKYVPPPPGVPYPLLWGNEAVVRQRFGNKVKDLQLTRRIWQIQFPFGVEESTEHFAKYFGPVKRSFDALSNDPQKQQQMKKELVEFWKKHNRANDGTLLCDAEWLEVIATKAPA